MNDIKHIFFDLDHTLWDFNKNSKLTFQQIFEHQKINIDVNDFKKVYTPVNDEYWKLYREEKVSQTALRYGRLKDTFDKLKFNITDDLIDIIALDYITNLANYNNLIEGTIELLEYLKNNYKLHIITNGFEEVQHLKLKNSNIKNYFDVIITSESVGVKKPNPKVFEFAVQSVGVQPHNCVMIGDSYEADVLGAFKSGMLPIHFNDQNSYSIPDKSFISVSRLLDIKQYL
ncbi:YjjG family noncanonical pyrimidine nucleotidase [Tenacibaculum sp. IB213877]|uniref:YjjG family noncanonical pyrimidine nucleotidase n=1 Tax=Tenacibaculum sp. IB213877 TaxID=3097351 RepID=UPI002A5A6C99|nr:YjjG family noncanonical pyrimidine nucleotidase [Tenacibaculum sp. IB213877]MDY0780090.1 YjjG family noncanonical pyrimidine nucleotidase [Tenacibaculum sp. IB213877]